MSASNCYQDHVFPAWKEFITGKCQTITYRTQVVESWIRCRQAVINPYDIAIHHELDGAPLHAVLTEIQELIKVAKPIMDNLYKFMQSSGFLVILTDNRGYIMEMFGDEDDLHNPMIDNFFQGACWQEKEEGTNAIGTALVIKEPIQISGAEHYCQKYHCLTCSAAPIFDNSGQLIGILNISGPAYTSHLHTLGMVVAAAEAITAQLAIQRKNQELVLSNKRLTNIFTTVSGGVLIADNCGNIDQLNPAAKEFLNRMDQQPIDRILGSKAALLRQMLQNQKSLTAYRSYGNYRKKLISRLGFR